MSYTLTVKPRGKPIKSLPSEITVPSDATATELYKAIAAKSRFSAHRLRITKGSDGSAVPNARDLSLETTGLRNQSTVYVKDLGPQIAWRTVFVVEYLGPILIHPLLYDLRPYIYSAPAGTAFPPPSTLQTLSLCLIVLHFVKRECETLFVHRFSAATMPARNIFKNSFHYWILAGLNIAFFTYRPSSPTQQAPRSPALPYIGIALFVLGELGNLSTHLTLRGLRSAGGNERGIPTGFGFSTVTCPNYMFEIMAWTGIWLVNWSLSTGFFVLIAVAQMAVWAKKKEAKYRKEFGLKYPRKRFVMLPGLI
ncbi:MAG: hypothetical protein M1819_002092 [Sarea resinae]|nr:MAG: hypothetical protein M1819_002092 [Sarea resinae]